MTDTGEYVGERREKYRDRRRIAIGEVVGITVLVLQLAAIVFGFGMMAAELRGLKEALGEVKIQSRSNADKINDVQTEVKVLQSQVKNHK